MKTLTFPLATLISITLMECTIKTDSEKNSQLVDTLEIYQPETSVAKQAPVDTLKPSVRIFFADDKTGSHKERFATVEEFLPLIELLKSQGGELMYDQITDGNPKNNFTNIRLVINRQPAPPHNITEKNPLIREKLLDKYNKSHALYQREYNLWSNNTDNEISDFLYLLQPLLEQPRIYKTTDFFVLKRALRFLTEDKLVWNGRVNSYLIINSDLQHTKDSLEFSVLQEITVYAINGDITQTPNFPLYVHFYFESIESCFQHLITAETK